MSGIDSRELWAAAKIINQPDNKKKMPKRRRDKEEFFFLAPSKLALNFISGRERCTQHQNWQG